MRYAQVMGMLLLGIALAIQAQDSGSGAGGSLSFSTVLVENARRFEANTKTGELKSMSGDVRLKFIPENPEDDALRLAAQEIRFSGPFNGGQPSRITMSGSVRVEGPLGNIKSDTADLDVAGNLLTFEGEVYIDSPDFKMGPMTKFVYDLETGDVLADNVSDGQIPLNQGDESPADPSLLRADDVNDWSAFLALLGKQSKEEGASPGKQIVSLMDAKTRGFLDSITPETPLDAKVERGAAKALNEVLAQPTMYSAAGWEGVELGAEAKQLAESGPDGLPEGDLLRLNRLLLEAAYPGYVKGR